MSDKFLNSTGLAALRNWIIQKLGLKQDTLVSGTNIKTINNKSILGSGNIDVSAGGSDVFVATYKITPIKDILTAYYSNKVIFIKSISYFGKSPLQVIYVRGQEEGWGDGGLVAITPENEHELGQNPIWYQANFSYDNVTEEYSWGSEYYQSLAFSDNLPKLATELTPGTIKLNPDESITLNSNNQLEVGGRLGQMSNTTGLYSPKTIKPASIGNGSFLLTEGSGQKLGNKSMAVVTGTSLNVKSASAGTTTYLVTNTYENKIICAGLVGGVLALNETTAAQNYVNITSVTIGGNDPSNVNYWTASGDITIKTDASINPNSTITSVRPYASGNVGFSNLFVGQLVGGNGGASIAVGQKVNCASGNANAIVGASMYNTGNGNAMFGRQHINKKNRAFLAGTGHDTTNAKNESVAVVGDWSDLSSSDILFAVGDGSSATNRSNAFEVRDQAIVLKSPNGTRYKITISDNGDLTTTAI